MGTSTQCIKNQLHVMGKKAGIDTARFNLCVRLVYLESIQRGIMFPVA